MISGAVTGASLVAHGISLGLAAAVPIGPVNVEIARRSLQGGFLAGLALGCGAVSVDLFYLVLSSLSLNWVARNPLIDRALTVGGLGLLTYLGVMCLRGERTAYRGDLLRALTPGDAAADTAMAGPATAHPPQPSAGAAYVTGVLMTLINPMTLGFWFLIVPERAGAITQESGESGRNLPMIGTGVFIGTLGWVVFFAGLLARAGRRRRAWWLALADAVGGVVLLTFAAGAFWRTVRPFL